MKVLGNKFLRAVAFVTACVILGIAAAFAAGYLNDYEEKAKEFNSSDIQSKYTDDFNELNSKLWSIANMYLRNLDSDGNFTGNKFFKAGTEKAMKDIGLMDKDGNITVGDYDDFEYILEYKGNSISNTKKSKSDFDAGYSFIQKNDIENYPYKLPYGICISEMSWYTTDYGLTYYNLPERISDRSIAIFDFDTKGLPSYIDDCGAQIFYKEDGSTPIPVEKKENLNEVSTDESQDGFGQISTSSHYIEQNGKKYLYFAGDDRPISIYISPSKAIIDQLEKQNELQIQIDKDMNDKMLGLLPLVIAALALGLFVVIFGGYDTDQKKFVLKAPNTIFTEFYVFIAFAALMGAGFFMGSIDDISIVFSDENKSSLPTYYGIAYGVMYAVGLFAVNAIVVQMKCKSVIRSSLIGRAIQRIVKGIKGIISEQMLRRDALTKRFLIRTAIAVMAECITIRAFYYSEELVFFLSVIYLAAYILLTIRDFRDINKMSEHISAMQSGDYTKVKVPETSVVYGMTKNLNEISDGMQTAVEKRVQSERMKIDLVTNVSHDLKTPLTSIISYIDLLGSEEMSPEARDYVKILDEKSARLKAIVSDLFDLAKATSGTDVAKEKLDAVILTQQVIGDMGDKIEKYGRDVRTEIKTESAPVMGDGKKLYRVIQNLTDNALKYSMDGTRIYITVSRDNSDAVITVKNISAEEMNFTAEEITERFARGDSSRSTEGSGLGLSIAKSFTEANGGQFNVLIDGDMFTAEVRLPITE
ncbi:MAG: HAMP domain-containing histidine kinase [Ruminococcus sp.]|nr:HAMP domain-containing histidine kinase [Ruminococcus sp.]